jgi:hypothetical protein
MCAQCRSCLRSGSLPNERRASATPTSRRPDLRSFRVSRPCPRSLQSTQLTLEAELRRFTGADGEIGHVEDFLMDCPAVPGFIDLLFYKGGAPPLKKAALSHMATISLRLSCM